MNLKNIGDCTKFSPAGLTKIVLFSTPEVVCFILNLMPGQQVPAHKHEDSTLTLTALQGRGTVSADGKPVPVAAGAVLLLKGGEELAIPDVQENLSLLATLSPNPENPMYSKEINA